MSNFMTVEVAGYDNIINLITIRKSRVVIVQRQGKTIAIALSGCEPVIITLGTDEASKDLYRKIRHELEPLTSTPYDQLVKDYRNLKDSYHDEVVLTKRYHDELEKERGVSANLCNELNALKASLKSNQLNATNPYDPTRVH